jgi:hypothetical protein
MTRRAVLLFAVLAASCRVEGKRAAFTAAGPEGDALAAAFNADIGKVRTIVLVAPT